MSPPKDSFFWQIHSGLPREGPGDNGSTRKAFSMATGLPPTPRVLDIGCGPGMQTIELASVSDGFIVGLDTHYPFLAELQRRAGASGVQERVKAINASMHAMPFPEASFDLIWSEGAMYFLGFRQALTAWKDLLTPRGYIAVTEPCWWKTVVPAEVKEIWAEYPAMTVAANWLPLIAESGFQLVGHFPLPEASWWKGYYAPMAARLAHLRVRHRADTAALSVIDEHDREIEAYRKYSAYYGYVFFVMRLV